MINDADLEPHVVYVRLFPYSWDRDGVCCTYLLLGVLEEAHSKGCSNLVLV